MIPSYVLTLPSSITRQYTVDFNALSATANSGRRMRWIKSVFNPMANDHLLTVFQHYDAKHRFECPECDDEFTTQAAVDQVSLSAIPLQLDFSPVPLALRRNPSFDRVPRVRS